MGVATMLEQVANSTATLNKVARTSLRISWDGQHLACQPEPLDEGMRTYSAYSSELL